MRSCSRSLRSPSTSFWAWRKRSWSLAACCIVTPRATRTRISTIPRIPTTMASGRWLGVLGTGSEGMSAGVAAGRSRGAVRVMTTVVPLEGGIPLRTARPGVLQRGQTISVCWAGTRARKPQVAQMNKAKEVGSMGVVGTVAMGRRMAVVPLVVPGLGALVVVVPGFAGITWGSCWARQWGQATRRPRWAASTRKRS